MKTLFTIIFFMLMTIGFTAYSKDYTNYINEAAADEKLDPKLLSSLCYIESRHNPKAINFDDGGEDSLGFCQIKLSTAKRFDKHATREKLLHVQFNLKMAAKYLAHQIKRYKGNIRKAVLAYNLGTYKPKTGTIKHLAVNESYFVKIEHIKKTLIEEAPIKILSSNVRM